MADGVLYEVPMVTSGTWFVQPVNLDGTDYNLEFQFNERTGLWYMDILDASESPLVQGIALVTGRDLLSPYRSRVLPNSLLFVLDTTGQDQNPGLESFLLTHKLMFGALP